MLDEDQAAVFFSQLFRGELLVPAKIEVMSRAGVADTDPDSLAFRAIAHLETGMLLRPPPTAMLDGIKQSFARGQQAIVQPLL